MRIKLSGDAGGIVITVIFALVVTTIIVGIINFIAGRLIKNEKAKKVVSAINALLYIATIVLLALDIMNILPFYRNILFSILGS